MISETLVAVLEAKDAVAAPPLLWGLSFQFSGVLLQGRTVVLNQTNRVHSVTRARVHCPHVVLACGSSPVCLRFYIHLAHMDCSPPTDQGIASSLLAHAICGADNDKPGKVSPSPASIWLYRSFIPSLSHSQPRMGFDVAL